MVVTGAPPSNSRLRQLSATVAGNEPISEAESSRMVEEVLSGLRDDEIKQVIAHDSQPKSFGCYMLSSKGKTRSLMVSMKQRLRSLAKLILCLRKKLGDEHLTLEDSLQPRHFDNIIACVQEVCSWELGDSNHPQSFKTPSLALKLGHALKKSAEVDIGLATRADDTDKKIKMEEYISLHEREWGDRVSHAALSTLDVRKMNVQDALPLTEDLVTLSSSLREKITETEQKLLAPHSCHEEVKLFNQLVTLTSAAVTIFNKRRGSESARILVKSYVNRHRGVVNQDIAGEPVSSRKETGRKDGSSRGAGKTEEDGACHPNMRSAMDVIAEVRRQMGLEGNPYLFARAKAKSHVPGWEAIKAACDICTLQKPELVTSTKLLKYLATVTQVLQLDSLQLEWVANHLGHSLEVHRQYYHLPSEILQLAKVSQLLLAAEQGCVNSYKGKTLNELDVKG